MAGDERTIDVNDATISADEHRRTPERPDVPAGAHVGRYIITGVLGRGGMGVVYAARDPKLERRVALKLLHHDGDGAGAERLIREAQALAKLSDPHVVTVYDADEHEGQVFVAMQLVDGQDLAAALVRRAPEPEQIIAWFVDAARGLAAAHEAGLVHRDFKPNNVLIDRNDRVAVTDFGLARSVEPDPERQTGLNVLAGTPAYMSPEQHALLPATAASDQFAFCVSLWEALFGQHPYLGATRETMTPFEIGYRIYDGALVPPPRSKVPRRILEALTRGLERDPARRWPSMRALIHELAPPLRRRMWPFVAAGAIALAGAGTAAWALVLRAPDRAAPPTCATHAQQRMASVWSATQAAQLRARFVATGKPYAEHAVTNATAQLERYASQWVTHATDACMAEQVAPTGELGLRRGACLDERLAALRVVTGLLAGEESPEVVERAHQVVGGLPGLHDCADTEALLGGPGRVPVELTAVVTPIEAELTAAVARGLAGDFPRAKAELAALVIRAQATGWAPLVARAQLALGLQQEMMTEPARAQLVRGAELATISRLDRDAARGWIAAVQAAGFEKSPDAVAVLAPIARAAATRLGDVSLQVRAEIAHGRALVRLRQWKEGGARCQAALETARAKLDGPIEEVDRARDCLLEALLPQGAYAEIEPLLATMLAERGARLSPDHPAVSDYLGVQVGMDLRRGKIAEARAKAERVLAIRERAFTGKHQKLADALRVLGDVASAEGNQPEAKQRYEAALAIADELEPLPLVMVTTLHTNLGYIAQLSDDHAGAVRHFERAIALTRERVGSEAIELAILLLNFGQIKSTDDLDAGVALLRQARAILERAGDRRAVTAGAVLAGVLVHHERWAEARALLEEALANADGNVEPEHLGLMKYNLARAVIATRGPRKRAAQLAREARRLLTQVGPSTADTVERLDAWRKQHRLR